jgi:cytochrome c oxidase cbb3-type subunit 3
VPTYFRIFGIGIFLLACNFIVQAEAAPGSGADVFQQQCAACHGADGKGHAYLKTPNFRDRKIQASLTDKKMIETIKNGKQGTAMPSFADKLSDKEIRSVVTFIRSFKK